MSLAYFYPPPGRISIGNHSCHDIIIMNNLTSNKVCYTPLNSIYLHMIGIQCVLQLYGAVRAYK